jgi:hypothetical protein
VEWVYVGPKFRPAQDQARDRLNGPQPPTLYDGMAAYSCGGRVRCASDGLADWVTAGVVSAGAGLAAAGVVFGAISCKAACLKLLGGPGAKVGQLAVDAASGDPVGNGISGGVSRGAGMADDIVRGSADDVIARAPGVATEAGGGLRVVGSGFSASERGAAEALAAQGRSVVLREASGLGRTSDLLVDGIPYDVYTPTTDNLDRIVSAIASKGSQVNGGGVVLDLSKSPLTGVDPAALLARVQGVTSNISDIIILGG